MPENKMFNNVRKVLGVVSELKNLGVEDLQDICSQYGKKTDNYSKDELIQIILKEELSAEEYDDYQKYLRYYYFIAFRENARGLSIIDETNTQLQDLYRVKEEASTQKRLAGDAKRRVELSTAYALPLVRLNIEYSHAERSFKDYIKVMTRTGMKRAKLSDELEDLKKKSILFRALKKGSIEAKQHEQAEFEVSASNEMDVAYKEYADGMKAYADILKELFFKMLDNRDVAEAILLYKGVSMDFDSPEAYTVGHLYETKLTEEQKEEIFEDFINTARFDPEVDLTGEIFFEAAKKYVARYYELMESRNSLKIARCVGAMEEIIKKQREVLDTMKTNQDQFDLYTSEEDKTLSLLYEEQGRIKK